MIKLIYFDILYPELWLPQVMTGVGLDMENVKNDMAVNLWFEEYGYESKQFVKNAGSTLVFLILYLFAWLMLLIFTFLSQISTK